MTLKQVPPLSPDRSNASYTPPPRTLGKSLAIGAVGLLLIALGWGVFRPEPPPPPSTASLPSGPAIRLVPSLVVPGPGQQPHPAASAPEARPDEVIIFRVEVGQPGYVLLGMENPDGTLTRLHGGRPDEKAISGSELIYEDGLVLAYALERHKGQTVTFVAALSEGPWRTIPERIPSKPPTWPTNGATTALSPAPPVIAWDRFQVRVAETVPTFTAP